MTRLSTLVILVGLARVVPLPPPLGIVLGAVLTAVGVGLRQFTEN
ncbi:transporter [Natronococcus occultus]|nr:transporter [Natronococcus occultus]